MELRTRHYALFGLIIITVMLIFMSYTNKDYMDHPITTDSTFVAIIMAIVGALATDKAANMRSKKEDDIENIGV